MLTVAAALVLLTVDELQPLPIADQVTVWCTSLALVTAACLILVVSRLKRAPAVASMHAGPWYLIWFGLAFALASLAWRTPQDLGRVTLSQPDVVRALVLLHVVVVTWTWGYLVGPATVVSRLGRRYARWLAPGGSYTVRSGATPWILAAVGLAGLVLQSRTGHIGYVGDASQLATAPSRTGQAIGIMIQCGTFAVIVAAIEFARRPSGGRRTTLLVLIGSQILVGGLAGGKQSFIVALLSPAIVLGAAGRFPWRSAIVGLLLFVAVVTPFIADYRKEVRTASYSLTPTESFALAPQIFTDVIRGGPTGAVGSSLDYLGNRIREVDSVGLVMRFTPSQIGYRSPRDLIEAPVLGIVPRYIWRSKPVLDDGQDFAHTYYDSPVGVYSADADPPAADLFRHGGVAVVAIGMFLLGLAIRLLDTTLHPSIDLRLALVFAPLFLTFVKSELALTGLIASLPAQLLVGVVVSRLAFRGKPAQLVTPSARPTPSTWRTPSSDR